MLIDCPIMWNSQLGAALFRAVVAPNHWLCSSVEILEKCVSTTFGFSTNFREIQEVFWEINFFAAQTSKNLIRHQRETFGTNFSAQQPFQCILISDSHSKHRFFYDDGSGPREWSALKDSIHHNKDCLPSSLVSALNLFTISLWLIMDYDFLLIAHLRSLRCFGCGARDVSWDFLRSATASARKNLRCSWRDRFTPNRH